MAMPACDEHQILEILDVRTSRLWPNLTASAPKDPASGLRPTIGESRKSAYSSVHHITDSVGLASLKSLEIQIQQSVERYVPPAHRADHAAILDDSEATNSEIESSLQSHDGLPHASYKPNSTNLHNPPGKATELFRASSSAQHTVYETAVESPRGSTTSLTSVETSPNKWEYQVKRIC